MSFENLLETQFNKSALEYVFALVKFLDKWKCFFFYKEKEYVIDFLLENNSKNRIPEDWMKTLRKMSIEQFLRAVLFGECQSWFVPSLTEYINQSFSYRLNWFKPQFFVEEEKREEVEGEEDLVSSSVLLSSLKDKKKHEVEILGEKIAQISKESNCNVIVNLGSGMGYLSHFLSFNYDMKVIGIDCNKKVLIKSTEISKTFEGKLKKKSNYFRIHSHIDSSITIEEFMEILEPEIEDNDRICLIGLHTCGNLGITTMNLFRHGIRFKAMVNVPCCYHKLRNNDFPLSHTLENFIIENKTFPRLSNGGFHLATQSIQKWYSSNVSESKTKNEGTKMDFHCKGAKFHLKMNSFRCALELFLNLNVKKMGNMKDLPFVVGSIPKKFCNEFSSYVLYAINKIRAEKKEVYKVSNEVIQKIKKNKRNEFVKELDDFYGKLLNKENDENYLMIIDRVKYFWMLRALLTPLLENLVLIDRYFFLKESCETGDRIDWFELFDSRISPRNKVLVGTKKP